MVFVRKHGPIAVLSILSILLLGLSGPDFAQGKEVKIKTVAVMPFGTFDVGDISIDMTLLITDGIKKREFYVVSQEMLEGFLIKKRIRRLDFLDRATIRAMGTVLGVDALVMGSVDLVSDGENPKISMNAQMIDCLDTSVIWANSFSHTGADYATFLDLGRITSLEQLVDIAVDDILTGLPDVVNLPGPVTDIADEEGSSLSPVEVIHATFSPDVLRGGESARLSIEVGEITATVQDIRAFVLDNEIKLSRQHGKCFSGTITAPAVEGTYPLKIYVTDRWNRLFSVDAMASLTVHNTAPEIAVLFRQRLISPNNDGINDTVVCFPEVLKANTLLHGWDVEITNGDGKVVRSEDGTGALPESFIWRGENDQKKTVEDGIYFYQLVVEDAAGNRTATAKEEIVVDTTPPEVDVAVGGESQAGIILVLKANDMSEIDYWELVLYDDTGAEAASFGGNGDIPETLTYVASRNQNGPEQEESTFSYSLEVRDIAGNRLEMEKQSLKRPETEGIEAEPAEEKRKVWVEDF